jgi:hypothetical protein
MSTIPVTAAKVSNFESMSVSHALASAYVTLLGFPSAPQWHRALNSTFIGRLISLTLFIYQGGGRENMLFSFLIASIFYIFTSITKFVHFTMKTKSEGYTNFINSISDKVKELASTGDETPSK